MTDRYDHHRPLVRGLRIEPGRKQDGEHSGMDSFGTFTGVATRNFDGSKVLVSKQHVLAGLEFRGGRRR